MWFITKWKSKNIGNNKAYYVAGRIDNVRHLLPQVVSDNLMGGLPTTHGHWEGERDNSLWLPDSDYVPRNRLYNNVFGKTWAQILQINSCWQGIRFTNGEIDFSRTGVVKAEVEIPRGILTCFDDKYLDYGKRTRLQDMAFNILAIQLGKTVEELIKRKNENVYVWHECADIKTMQLVPREIHDNITHRGGIALLKASIQTEL